MNNGILGRKRKLIMIIIVGAGLRALSYEKEAHNDNHSGGGT